MQSSELYRHQWRIIIGAHNHQTIACSHSVLQGDRNSETIELGDIVVVNASRVIGRDQVWRARGGGRIQVRHFVRTHVEILRIIAGLVLQGQGIVVHRRIQIGHRDLLAAVHRCVQAQDEFGVVNRITFDRGDFDQLAVHGHMEGIGW